MKNENVSNLKPEARPIDFPDYRPIGDDNKIIGQDWSRGAPHISKQVWNEQGHIINPFANNTVDPFSEARIDLDAPAGEPTTMEWNVLDPSDGRSDTMEWRFLDHGHGEVQNLGGEPSKEWNGLDAQVSNLDNEATVLQNNPEFA